MAMKSTALTSGEPTRLIALLIADPRPALRDRHRAHQRGRQRRDEQRDADAEDDERRAATSTQRVRRRHERARVGRASASQGSSRPGCAPATAARPP